MSETPFRILSLDGGGIRGLFGAAFLSHLEQHSGVRLIDHFDLIVGTSTGAIIALGLASGLSAREVLGFYEERGPAIFAGGSSLRWLTRPKHRNDELEKAVRAIMGDKTLADLQVPVCIPSYELVQGHPRVFKDNHHPNLHWGGSLPVWKVAMASAAAPTYFPSFQMEGNDCYIDGGIWANNPIMVGITEAVKYFDQPLTNIVALSVGTGSMVTRLPHAEAKKRGMFGWGWKARYISVSMDAQATAADQAACLMLGQDRYLRVDADLNRAIALDSYDEARPLIERGEHYGRQYLNRVRRDFLSAPRSTMVR